MAGILDFLSGLNNMLGAATYTRPQDIAAVRGLLPQSVDNAAQTAFASPPANDALGLLGGLGSALPIGVGKPPERGFVVALKHGGKIYYGRDGETHLDLLERRDLGGVEHELQDGFAGPNGAFLTREQAIDGAMPFQGPPK